MKKYFTYIQLKFFFLLFLIVVTSACASIAQDVENHRFHLWLMAFNKEAEQGNISSKTIYQFMKDAQYLPRVIELDRKQPDKTKSFEQYLQGALTAKRIKNAKEKYAENRQILNEIGKKYGVQPKFIVALWGSESDFGRNMGSFKVTDSLATLAFEGRRADFFKAELLKALKIIDSENIDQASMKGSWAGAMGQTQFMPTSFFAFAVDYDNDGKKDIWGTKADVFASIANYLAKSGWDNNSNWGREVKLPKGFDEKLLGRNIEKTIAEWKALGIKNIDGKALANKKTIQASVIRVEDNNHSRVFLVYPNYKILLKWNRSLYFATTIGMLADKVPK